jgi:hypothetical protein
MSQIARLPGNPPGGGDPLGPAGLYKIAVDEYRFQAQYNWSRTQYLLAFNAGILAVGVGLSQRSLLVVAVFALGLLAAVLSASVVRTQHGYYRAARDHMKRLEEDLAIPEGQRLDTTSTLGGRARAISVNQVVYLLLATIAVADVFGIVAALTTAA